VFFKFKRKLLGELCRCAVRALLFYFLSFEKEGQVSYRYGKDPQEVERLDYLEFIARVTSRIPDKGQVTVRYYGLYANAHRGKVRKASLEAFPLRIVEDELRRLPAKGWALDLWLGKDLAGAKLGIIGFGRIGRAVARRAASFGAEILYYDPDRLMPDIEKFYRAAFMPLDDLLREADIITIHAGLTPETHHLISKRRLALIKKDAVLINTARGPIVDEKALAEALAEGRLWGAGLDVYEREPEIEDKLLNLDNVVLLPHIHIGSATTATRLRMALTAARNLIQGLRGERPDNPVF